MRRTAPLLLLLALALAALPARADEAVAVVAVAEPPAGPDADLFRLAERLRAACRERLPGLLGEGELRARLSGEPPALELAGLERSAAAAVLAYRTGEFGRAALAWRSVLAALETLSDGPEVHGQWTRAVLRAAHAEAAQGRWAEARATMEKLLAVEPRYAPDPDEYSPSYRRAFDEVRQRLRARPARRLTITSAGRPGAVFVNGKAVGVTPVTVALPAGRYRVSGSSGGLRVMPASVELGAGDASLALDFGLSDALRTEAGPGLALPSAGRPAALRELGSRLGLDRLVAVSARVDAGTTELFATLLDVRRGGVAREGSVRLPAGADPGPKLRALAAYLVTGLRGEGVEGAGGPPSAAAAATPAPALAPLRAPAPEPSPIGGPAPVLALRPAAASDSAQAPAVRPATQAAEVGRGAARRAGPPARVPSLREASFIQSPAAGAPALPAAAPLPFAVLPAALQPVAPAGAIPGASPALQEAPGASPRSVGAPTTAPARIRSRWLRPAAWIAGALALGLAGTASWEALSCSSAQDRANAMVRADGLLAPGADPARYRDALGDADRSRRLAWVSAGSSAALAGTAALLGWLSGGEPAATSR